MNLRIDFNPGNALAVLNGLGDSVMEAKVAKAMAERYTTEILDWIALGNAFTSRTGQIEQSIGWRPDGNGAVVFANAEHAAYLEFGTGIHGEAGKPYFIKPKAGRKALRIPQAGGGYDFRRGVLHPGIKAMPFFFADQAAREEALLDTALQVLGGSIHG